MANSGLSSLTDNWQQKYLPHLLVLLAGFMVLAFYFKPALIDGKSIPMDDIVQGKGMRKEVMDFRENTGEEALWTNSMFSGMPAYLISTKHPGNLFTTVDKALNFGMPKPVNRMFRIFAGFYILMLVLGINPWLSGIGALGFAFSSYFFIILEVGHITKMNAIAYMGPVVAGVIMAYRGKWLLGGLMTAFFTALEINANHFQITFYLIFILIAVAAAYFVNYLKADRLPDFAKVTAILVLAGLLGVGPNISRLWTTIEYTPETIRGGSSAEIGETKKDEGLDLGYALRWSYSPKETFTLLVPNFHGGASSAPLSESSSTYEVLKKYSGPQNAKEQIKSWPTYWGDQPFTAGPVYVGAIFVFLFVLGLLVVPGPMKWALLAVTFVAIVLSWGRNIMWLTEFFFEYVPVYNKFRAVAMFLVVAEFTMPLLGILAVHRYVRIKEGKLKADFDLNKAIYISAGIVGGILLILAAIGAEPFGLSGEGYEQTFYGLLGIKNPANADPRALQMARELAVALFEDQNSMFRMDALRSLLFVALGGGLLWAFVNDKLNKKVMMAGLAILVIADLWPVAQRYLSEDDFESDRKIASTFTPTKIDLGIKQDAQKNNLVHYRVLNLAANTFNDAKTSYHHKSVGGYHAAKLRRYQDLIENHIGQNNRAVWNMLNTKYVIFKNRETGKTQFQRQGGLGNAWAVKDVIWAENSDEALNLLSDKLIRVKDLGGSGGTYIKGKAVKDTLVKPNTRITLSNKKNWREKGNSWSVDLYNLPLSQEGVSFTMGSGDNYVNVLSSMPTSMFPRKYYDILDTAHVELSFEHNFQPGKEAIVHERFRDNLEGMNFPVEQNAEVELKSYAPNKLEYFFSSQSEQLVVFSEIYYNEDKGWKAFIDGQPAEHFRVNYVLRAMRVPAGDHNIEFRFEPQSYFTGNTISMIFSILLLVGGIGILYLKFRPSELPQENPSADREGEE